MGYHEPLRQLLRRPTWAQGLLVSVVLAVFTSLPAAAESVLVIVHPATNVTSVSRPELSKIFLKRLRTWASGESALPIDQAPGPVRQAFSTEIHVRSVITIEVFWKRMIFSGRAVPPPEAADDAAVLEYVRSTPGAVGYVSLAADLSGVRTLNVSGIQSNEE